MTSSRPSQEGDRSAAVIAVLLVAAMVFFGVVSKHDNKNWNKMTGAAKAWIKAVEKGK